MSVELDFAHEIADDMRSSQSPRTWRKVTTILSAYKRYKLTQNLRHEIEADLIGAGLECVPSMLQVDRADRVRLTLSEIASSAVEAKPNSDGFAPRGLTLWENRGSGWREAPLSPTSGSLLIIDIDLALISDVAAIGGAIPERLPGFNDEILQDLMTPDPHATFKRKVGQTRRASVFVVASDPDDDDSYDKEIPLSQTLVEFAIGSGWLVIARHPSQGYLNGSPAQGNRPSPTAPEFMASLQDCGLENATSSQEAALAIVSHSVDSFAWARGSLASYLESWRTEFASGSTDKRVLMGIQATLPLVVDALEPLLHPRVSAWARSTSVEEAVHLGEQMLRSLDALHSLQGTTAAAIATADQAQNEKYQRKLATLAAVFLAPTLVASVFGANQVLEDSPQDLMWLVVGMIVAGVATGLAISQKFSPRRRLSSPRAATAPKSNGASHRGLRQSSNVVRGKHVESSPKATQPLRIPTPE